MSDGDVCVMNIGPRERRKRFTFGVFTLALSLVMLGVLWQTGVSLAWRLLLFLPFYAAATGYFQARDKT